MEPMPEEIIDHYRQVREEDRLTTGPGLIELARTREVLRRHLPPAPARILDVGGATGIHASWLAEDGYRVDLVDIVDSHVARAAEVLGPRGVTAHLGDARALPFDDDSFDAAVLLGPIYHLTEESDRLSALAEARRVVRPGGTVAVAAVNRFASLFDGLTRGILSDPEFAAIVRDDLAAGQHRNPTGRPTWWTTAFFHRPEQLRAEAERAGLVVLELVGLEGLAAYLPDIDRRWADPADREALLGAARAVESEPSLLGLSPHLLLVGTVDSTGS